MRFTHNALNLSKLTANLIWCCSAHKPDWENYHKPRCMRATQSVRRICSNLDECYGIARFALAREPGKPYCHGYSVLTHMFPHWGRGAFVAGVVAQTPFLLELDNPVSIVHLPLSLHAFVKASRYHNTALLLVVGALSVMCVGLERMRKTLMCCRCSFAHVQMLARCQAAMKRMAAKTFAARVRVRRPVYLFRSDRLEDLHNSQCELILYNGAVLDDTPY